MRVALMAGLLMLAALPVAADDIPGEIPCDSAKLRMPHLPAIEAAFEAGVREICIVNDDSGRASDSGGIFVSLTEYGSYVLSDTLNVSITIWTTARRHEGVAHNSIPEIIATDDWFEGGHMVGEEFSVGPYDAGWAYLPDISTTCLVAEAGVQQVTGTANGYRQVRLIEYCVASKEQLSQAEAEAIIRAADEALAKVP